MISKEDSMGTLIKYKRLSINKSKDNKEINLKISLKHKNRRKLKN